MLVGTAFRHQIILPSHQSLYDYWRSKCRGGALPTREDINPSDIRDLLPTISISEVCTETGAMTETGERTRRFRMRLAGTGFYDLYREEITGRYVDNLPIGNKTSYWDRILNRVVDRKRPSAGLTRPGTPYGSHLTQFWIRLPLSDDGETVSMILGYDHLASVGEAEARTMLPAQVSA